MKQWIVAVIAVLAMSGSVDAVEYTWTGAGGDGEQDFAVGRLP